MERQTSPQAINNEFYDRLEEEWYTASHHPIALLRAEHRIRTPWVLAEIERRFKENISLLDIGCGAGFLTNAAAEKGHRIVGVDLSATSLEIAHRHDKTTSVHYLQANGYSLPFPAETFEVVCAMDLLEHLEEPRSLIAEASRVLKKGGCFFFHTFNRNFLSYLFVIKGVEWFVRNTPKDMHVYPLFIKPEEVRQFCSDSHLRVEKMEGLKPKIFSLPFFQLLFTRTVSSCFSFCFSKSLMTGYCGIARKVS